MKLFINYSGWIFFCAVLSIYGFSGYYSDLWRDRVPDWVAVGILISPITIIIMVQWGEAPDRLVVISHIVAGSIVLLFGVGMEVMHWLGYRTETSTLSRIMAHIGWVFAWAGILKQARKYYRTTNGEQNSAPDASPEGIFSDDL